MHEPPPQPSFEPTDPPARTQPPAPRPGWSAARYLAGLAIPFGIVFAVIGISSRDPEPAALLLMIGLAGFGALFHAIITRRWAFFLGLLTTIVGAPLIFFIYCVTKFQT